MSDQIDWKNVFQTLHNRMSLYPNDFMIGQDSAAFTNVPMQTVPTQLKSSRPSNRLGVPSNMLSGYNKFMKGVASYGNPSASFLKSPLGQLSGAASQTGQLNAMAQFARKPTLGTGVTGAATYALNANPYYAGLNALTGGALDRGVGSAVTSIGRTLGLSRRPPAQNTQLATRQGDYQRQINERGNELMKAYGRYRQEEEEAQRQAEAYRMSGLNLAREGLSARDMAGPMAMLMNPAMEARDAAIANTQADLSRRGISGGGIAAGTRAAIEGAVASGAATARGTLAQNAAERAQSMQDNMLTADMNRAYRTGQLGLSALGSATDTATQLQELQMRQQAMDMENAEARRKRELETFQAIGEVAGLYGPDLRRWMQSLRKRGEGTGTTAGMTGSDGMTGRPIVSTFDGNQVYADTGLPVDPLSAEFMPRSGPFEFPEDINTQRLDFPKQALEIGTEEKEFDPRRNTLGTFTMPTGRIGGPAPVPTGRFTRDVDPVTAYRLDASFALVSPGQVVTDPLTGMNFMKTVQGWRKQ